MKILISNTSDSPLYQQIKDQIKDAILKEELVEGDALPSIRAFANDLASCRAENARYDTNCEITENY